MYSSKFIKSFKKQLKWDWCQIKYIIKANKINCTLDVPANEHQVNIFDYRPDKYEYDLFLGQPYNLGDYLGRIICLYMLNLKGIKIDKYISKKKHLFTVGSNILGGKTHGNYQDTTIWGSGVLKMPTRRDCFFQGLSRRKLDIRAVRGPLTKGVLDKLGHKCPEVYGDPAILMPLIYQPTVEKRYSYSVVCQFVHERRFREQHPNEHIVSMNTNDYKAVIDEIVASNVVYTSSLHGIILAEAYGVPAVFFRQLKNDFKYYDYYFSTGRRDIVIAETFEEALKMKPLPLPDLSKLRQGLLDSFPYDLWD